MKFPVLTVTGYYDDDQPGALRYYRAHVAHAPAEAVARHYLVIGPWDHPGSQEPVGGHRGCCRYPMRPSSTCRNCTPTGTTSLLDRGPRPALLRDRVAYFMLGADQWRYANTLESASSGKQLRLFPQRFVRDAPAMYFNRDSLRRRRKHSEPPAIIVSNPHELPELELAKYAANEDLTSQFRAFQTRVRHVSLRAPSRADPKWPARCA